MDDSATRQGSVSIGNRFARDTPKCQRLQTRRKEQANISRATRKKLRRRKHIRDSRREVRDEKNCDGIQATCQDWQAKGQGLASTRKHIRRSNGRASDMHDVFDGKWQTTGEQTWQAKFQARGNMSRGKGDMAGKSKPIRGDWRQTRENQACECDKPVTWKHVRSDRWQGRDAQDLRNMGR